MRHLLSLFSFFAGVLRPIVSVRNVVLLIVSGVCSPLFWFLFSLRSVPFLSMFLRRGNMFWFLLLMSLLPSVSAMVNRGQVNPTQIGFVSAAGLSAGAAFSLSQESSSRAGKCVGCKKTFQNLANHLRATTPCCSFSDSQFALMGYNRCEWCRLPFKVLSRHYPNCRNKGPAASNLDSAPSSPVSESSEQSRSDTSSDFSFTQHTTASHARRSGAYEDSVASGELSFTYSPSTPVRPPSSPSSGPRQSPAPFEAPSEADSAVDNTPPANSAPLPPPSEPHPVPESDPISQPSESLEWVDFFSPKLMSTNAVSRNTPFELRKSVSKALYRTSNIALRSAKSFSGFDHATKAILLLPKVCYGTWTYGVKGWGRKGRVLRSKLLGEYPFLSDDLLGIVKEEMSRFRPPRFRDLSELDQKLKAASARMKDGEPGKAAKVLVSRGLVPVTEETIQKLKEIHPDSLYPDEPPLPPAPINLRRLSVNASSDVHEKELPTPTKSTVTKVVKSLPKKSAPGPSGWTFGMISHGIKDSIHFRDFLLKLISTMKIDHNVPASDWLRTAMLYPLRKKDDGIRPIACGEAFARLTAKWIISSIRPSDYLLPEQYGVGTGVDEVLCHINDSIPLCVNGISSFDISNAFNTLSRHHIGSVLGVFCPALLGYFRWGYGVMSDLFLRGPDGVHIVQSQEGGRQGDPLFPFLFSLGIRPLVDELGEKFALKVSLAGKDGSISTKRLIWVYLDDITIALREGVSHQDVLDFLSQPEIVEKYGLRVNESKSWFMGFHDLVSTGHKLLGSWIGGPDNDTSGSRQLFSDALNRLYGIIPVLKMMPIQHGLTLLRLCYYPILNHLLRSLPVGIGNTELRAFDKEIWQTVASWTNDSTVKCGEEIVKLPRRLGGLGFFDSIATRPYAAAASFIQSYGYLQSKDITLTEHLEGKLRPCLEQFAEDLDVQYQELFEDEIWRDFDLQRRGAELSRESSWFVVFRKLSTYDQIRFIENQSILRRKWVDCLPISPANTLSDEEVRYGLRECLLSDFPEAVSPTGQCSHCNNQPDSPNHHLSCKLAGALRTTRHTAINSCFEKYMKEIVGVKAVEHRPYAGMSSQGESLFGDTGATIGGVRSNYDYTVTTVTYDRPFSEPSEEDVDKEIEIDKLSGTRNMDRFLFWEDHSDEVPHRNTVRARKFRQMVFQQTVGRDLAEANRRKRVHYGDLLVVPVAFTARGSLGRHTIPLIDSLCTENIRWERDYPDRVQFRHNLLCQLSIILLRSAHRMKALRAEHAFAAYQKAGSAFCVVFLCFDFFNTGYRSVTIKVYFF